MLYFKEIKIKNSQYIFYNQGKKIKEKQGFLRESDF